MANGGNQERNRQRLLVVIADWTVWPYDAAAAEEYGRLVAQLKRVGRVIQQIDM